MIASLLVGITFYVQHPMDKDFNHCLEELMQQNRIEDKELLLLSHPDLRIAENNCRKVKALRLKIEMIKGGAAPQVSQTDYEKIKKHQKHIRSLEIQNQNILSQVLATSQYNGL